MTTYEPTSDELFAYKQLWQFATKGKAATIGGKDAVDFFLKSGLQIPVLKSVWALASNGKSEMGPPEFSCAMRLLALAQAGQTVDQGVLDRTKGMVLPPPTFNGVELQRPAASSNAGTLDRKSSQGKMSAASSSASSPAPPPPPSAAQAPAPSGATSGGGGGSWAIPPDAAKNYVRIWASQNKNADGLLEGKDAAPFFAKSGQERNVLRQIWQLSDMGADGSLDETEFYVGMHLTMMAKKGATLPDAVPPELVQSARAIASSSGSSGGAGAGADTSSLNVSAMMAPTPTPPQPQAQPPPPPPAIVPPAPTPTPMPVPVPAAIAAPITSNNNDDIAQATRAVQSASATLQRHASSSQAEVERLRGEREALTAALQEATRRLQADSDRVRELDEEVARLRQDVAGLRAQLDARRAAISAQQDQVAARVDEMRTLAKQMSASVAAPPAAQGSSQAPGMKRHASPGTFDDAFGASPTSAGGAAPSGGAFDTFLDYGAPGQSHQPSSSSSSTGAF